MIGNAKNTTDRALSLSPKKKGPSLANRSVSKLRVESVMGSAHKTLSMKQVE